MAKTAPRKKAAPQARKPARKASAPKKPSPKAKKRPARASRPAPDVSLVPPPPEAPEGPAEPVAPESSAAAPEPEPRALPAGEPAGPTLPFEIDPKRIEESLHKLQGEMVHWANKGRYTKVRFKFRGKQLLPDLPLAAVVAAEGLTFYWGGILRMLVANVVGHSVFQVEFVNDADKRVQAGREALLSGDMEQALALFREALAMDRDNPGALLNLGVALKLQGDRDGALAAFERARAQDPEGPIGAEAERLAAPLRPKDSASSA